MKTKKPGTGKKKAAGSFFFTKPQKTAVIILCALMALNAAAVIFFRVSASRIIDRDIERAESLHAAGDYEGFMEIIGDITRRRPSLEEAPGIKFLTASAMEELSDSGRAESIWREIVAAGEDGEYYPASLYNLARLRLQAGDIPDAAVKLERVVKSFPGAGITPRAVLDLARCYRRAQRWDEARRLYKRAIGEYAESPVCGYAAEELGQMNIELIFSPAMTSYDVFYTVKRGDTLASIASGANTTVDLIMIANGLTSPIIQVGQRLKLTPGKFEILVNADRNILTLKYDGSFFKRYPVGTGEHGKTPLGEFRITDKLERPVWYARDGVYPYGHEKNILGTRWLGINVPRYGIHGTTLPETIGTHETAGCVRMYNEDVEELYRLVTEGTPVIITGTDAPDDW